MQVASAAPLSEGQGSRGWEMWVQGGDEGEKALPMGGGAGRRTNDVFRRRETSTATLSIC